MSERERDRLKILHEVAAGHLKPRQGAAQCGMSERGFRKLLKGYREQGDAAVAHGLRGRASNRRLEEETAARAVEAIERRYRDFGPTLAAEYLRKDERLVISRESLRQLMMQRCIWRAKPRKLGAAQVWRPRRSCRGELVQWDTSVHAWLEDRGPEKMYLVTLIDDATSTLLARFVAADSTEHHMRVLWAYMARYGRPQAVYTEIPDADTNAARAIPKTGLFQPALSPGWKDEEPGPKNETQMGRALRELGIEWIAAHSPQAKGRMERSFGSLQDRLVKGLRMAGAATLEEANRHLEESFLHEWNQRFVVASENGVDEHREIRDTALSGKHSEPCRAAAGKQRLHDCLGGSALADSEGGAAAGSARNHDSDRGAAGWHATGADWRRLRQAELMRDTRQQAETAKAQGEAIRTPARPKPVDGRIQRQRPADVDSGRNGCERNPNSLRQRGILFPFPVFPRGKAGAGGFPHAAQSAEPPIKRAAAPLCIPREHEGSYQRLGTFYFAEFRKFLFCVDT